VPTQPRDKRLYWRGGKLWCRVPTLAGRVRKPTGCSDEKAASARADEFERRYADPSGAAAQAATLEGSIRALLKDMVRRGRSEATLDIAAQKLAHFPRLWGKSLPMADIQSPIVLSYMEQRKEDGVVDFTIKKEIEHLTQMLKVAKFLKVYPYDIATVIPPFIPGSPTPKTRTPTLPEAAAVLRALGTERAAHLAYFVATGARRSEAARAERGDVHFDEMRVFIHGKKTKKSRADVPITSITRPWLDFALENAPGKEQGDLLFHPWGNLSRDLNAACVRAEVERFTPNDLRRSFASWHRDGGVSVELVSKMLRHTTIKLAESTYADMAVMATGHLVRGALSAAESARSSYEKSARLDLDPPGGLTGHDAGTLVCEALAAVESAKSSGPAKSAVLDLYRAGGLESPNALLRPNAESEKAKEYEAFAGAAPGNRTPALRFTKPHVKGCSNAIKEVVSSIGAVCTVPILYPGPECTPTDPVLTAWRRERPREAPSAWVHEATANLYELLVGPS
jgi:integrase